MTKIIIGYDGGEQSEDALTLGRMLAELLAAQPLVVAAATWPSYLMGREDVEAALHADVDPLLEHAADRLADFNPETRAIRTQSVARELTAIAEEEGAVVIVIGSSRYGQFGRIALGSVGASIVHGSPCAIAVAPKGLAGAESPHLLRIGVAFDGGPEAWSALDAGVGLAERTHAKLSVLTVAEPPTYGLGSAWAALSAAELEDAERKDKQRVLDLALGRVPSGLPVEGRLLTGPPGQALAEASQDLDLLAIGSRGYGPIGRTFLGSVATAVIHHCQCSTLVLPRGAGADPFTLKSRAHLAGEPA